MQWASSFYVAMLIAIYRKKISGLQLVLRDAKYKNTSSSFILLITGADFFLVLTDDYYLFSCIHY